MSAAFHPPAAGGKTAWGVGDLVTKVGEDTEELNRKRKAAAEFNDREQKRLNSLKEMDKKAGEIIESRRERKKNFELSIIDGADEFKNKQLEILRRLEENKLQRKLDKRERANQDGVAPKNKEKKKSATAKKKKKKKDSSSSSSDSSSSESSSDSSSSSSSGKKAKNKQKKKGEQNLPKEVPAPPLSAEAEAEQRALQAEARRKAEEAKAKEREVKMKAKQQLAAFEAESKRKKEAEEARRQAESQKRIDDAEARRKADFQQKKEEEEAKKKADESKKLSEAALARKKAAEEAASKVKSAATGTKAKGLRETVAGGFCQGQHVVATQDITIRGNLIVRNGTAGTILGRADTDPVNRIAVKFVTRADGGNASINCVPREIRKG